MINKKNIKNLLLNEIENYIVLYEDGSSLYNIESELYNEHKFFSKEAKDFIDNNFKKINKKINSGGDVIYGLTSFENHSNRMFVGFEKGDYKTYMATREKGYLKYIQNGDFFIIPIIVNIVVSTNDNKIMVIKTKEYEELFGDFIRDIDVVDDKIDFLGSTRRITSEVVGDNNLEIFDYKIIGVYKSAYSCIFVMSQKLNINSNEILDRNKNKDIAIDFISNKESALGKIICDGFYSKHVRQAFKFYLKETYGSYKYMNVKLV